MVQKYFLRKGLPLNVKTPKFRKTKEVRQNKTNNCKTAERKQRAFKHHDLLKETKMLPTGAGLSDFLGEGANFLLG